MCRVLKVSRSGYYAWRRRRPSSREVEDAILAKTIRTLHRDGDITQIRTKQGWLYLAVVLDLYSRKVVGWATGERPQQELALAALENALAARRPTPGLLHHTDRGGAYASAEYQSLLDRHGLVCSMSRSGDCHDNAVAESFFHTLKTEWTYHFRFRTRQQARLAVFDYIEAFYNRNRLHSTLNYQSPEDFEKIHSAA